VAYADANHTNRKLGTGAAVLLLEAGLAWAVVTGLAMHFNPRSETRTTTFDVRTPKDPPKHDPVKPQDPIRTPPQTATKPLTDPLVDTGPAALPTFAATTGDDSGGAIREVVFTPPTPAPQRFTPKAARPKGAMAGWVTDNDYPSADLRGEHEGRTSYRLGIDASGKVTSCTITASSGWPGLDKATCDRISQRGKFEPATNDEGERVAGTFTSAVTWRIPDE